MPVPRNDLIQTVEREGFVIVRRAFSANRVDSLVAELTAALQSPSAQNESVRGESGVVYAARNVLTLWRGAGMVWRRPALMKALDAILGPEFGLVRVLFFDKPPDRTWALPWHKDLTIAIRDHAPASPRFGKPTRKAGVPHVEAPRDVLEQMLTARIHLDDVTDENGPLKVIPGSHQTGKELVLGTVPPRAIHARRGDVLLIRPLVAHCSNKSHPECRRHRRILHLEFAACPYLPDGYRWHDFITGAT